MSGLAAELRSLFSATFGGSAEPRVVLAPGRVNLIGEHTDYNDGFVLPMAIDRHVGVAFTAREDGVVRAHAPDFGESATIELDRLDPPRHDGWARYVAGVCWTFAGDGHALRGMDLVIRGDVPVGAGLSSSAALEMALARAICECSGIDWDPARAALLGQKAERDYVGVSCGIMDQFASAMPEDGCALLLDCRSLETEPVPLPRETSVVVMDTGLRRTLSDSAYNERFDRCQEAVRVIRTEHPEVRALRDVTPEMLEAFEGRMDPVTYRRASHVVSENLRPPALRAALEQGHLLRAGRLMNDSHRSLRELYEVSCEELDCIVAVAERHPACFGARLTGAGFGGCAVALVRRAGIDDFIDSVQAQYSTRFPRHASAIYACEPSAGARLVD